jgi:hypothetical protein
MDEQKVAFLEALMELYEQDDLRLNDWERGFMKDMSARFNKYASGTYISDKQWNAIKKIAAAYDLELEQF